MLNKAPNKNDVTCIANVVLNEVPNSNDAMHVANNVRLNTMGAQQSQWRLYSQHHVGKSTYQRQEIMR